MKGRKTGRITFKSNDASKSRGLETGMGIRTTYWFLKPVENFRIKMPWRRVYGNNVRCGTRTKKSRICR